MNRKTLVGLIAGTALCLTLVGSSMPAGAQTTDPASPAPNNVIAPAAQAVGTFFTFQGQLKKGGGTFSGACSFRFTLFDAATGGLQVDTPRMVDATVLNGLFTAELNFGNQFKGQARWLETAVKCAGDGDFIVQSPRLSMTSSPYAIGLVPGVVMQGATSNAYDAVFWVKNADVVVGAAVRGESTGGFGVQGRGAVGVEGRGKNSGVSGGSEDGLGVDGVSSNSIGVRGVSSSETAAGVYGQNVNTGPGVRGHSVGNAGVYGSSDNAFGVYGEATNNYAIKGKSLNSVGVYGESTNSVGVYGSGTTQAGVRGHSVGNAGVHGSSDNAFGVYGEATNNYAIKGKSLNSVGVYGESTNSAGVYGLSTKYHGVVGRTLDPTKYAILADGKMAITGGTDIAERFSSASSQPIEPGTVVVMDADYPGKIYPSASAYAPTVVGIVSGAGGVEPGLVLHQKGMMEGPHIVAIAGRVYVKATAANGVIKPGDLLTSSDLAGHAMKATDRDLAFGAIIGKALTGLDTDTGLVLVLVNLQ